jgi:uncharacterized surface protein with fasciclin (FAS1) repeats
LTAAIIDANLISNTLLLLFLFLQVSLKMNVAGKAAMPLPPKDIKSGKTIADTVKSTGTHNTLAAALAAAKLDSALAGDGKLTLFAPTDEAFEKLPAGTVDALLKDIPKLTNILKYHVSSNLQRPSRNGRSYDTLCLSEDGSSKETGVLVTVDTCENFMLSANAKAKVISTVECTNGMIYVTDGVMLPYDGIKPPFGPGTESKDAGLAAFNKGTL